MAWREEKCSFHDAEGYCNPITTDEAGRILVDRDTYWRTFIAPKGARISHFLRVRNSLPLDGE
jgi:hypothetical protein